MARSKKSARSLASLTCNIVSAYCAGRWPPPDLSDLIASVGAALGRVARQDGAAEAAQLSQQQVRRVKRRVSAQRGARTDVACAANDNLVAGVDDGLDVVDKGRWLVPFPVWNRAVAADLPLSDEQAS